MIKNQNIEYIDHYHSFKTNNELDLYNDPHIHSGVLKYHLYLKNKDLQRLRREGCLLSIMYQKFLDVSLATQRQTINPAV